MTERDPEPSSGEVPLQAGDVPPRSGYQAAASLREELGLIVRLGLPVAVAQVGLLTMGLVDTWMVGGLGPLALGAVSLGDAFFFTILVLAMGIVGGLDPLIAQAHGAGEPGRCAQALRAGVRLAWLLTLPAAALMFFAIEPVLALQEIEPEVIQSTMDYVSACVPGVLPGLLFMAVRSLFNGLGNTRPAMVVALLANLLNVALDWILIYGHWGAPALGVAGSGVATSCCRWFMFAGLLFWLGRPHYAAYRQRKPVPLPVLAKAFRIGLPIGISHTVEVGAFATCGVFVAQLGVVPLASHQIAIKMATASFMVAIALGVATSIRVGNGIGAGRAQDAQRSAWVGIFTGMACMAVAGLIFVSLGRPIVAVFSPDPRVIELGAALLVVAAAFQLSDGTQAVASGALRGAGQTTFPLVAHIVGLWVIALPVGYAWVHWGGGGAAQIWWGLALGLTVVAGILLLRVRHLHKARAIEPTRR